MAVPLVITLLLLGMNLPAKAAGQVNPIVANDSFNDPATTSWGTASPGGTWQYTTNSTFATTTGGDPKGSVTVPSKNAAAAQLPVSALDTEVSAVYRINSALVNKAFPLRVSIVARADSLAAANPVSYRATAKIAQNGNVSYGASSATPSETDITTPAWKQAVMPGTSTAEKFTAQTDWLLHARFIPAFGGGTVIQVYTCKADATNTACAGSQAPWTSTVQTTASIADAGQIGLRVKREGSNTTPFNVLFDDFTVRGSATGVSLRLSDSASVDQAWLSRSDSVVGSPTNGSLKVMSIMLFWSDIQSQSGFNWEALDSALLSASQRGYKVIVRIMAGADAPSSVCQAMQCLNLQATDSSPRHPAGSNITIPDPRQTTALATQYRSLIQSLNAHLSAPITVSGTTISKPADLVYFVPISMPTELGTEMALGYGTGAVGAFNKCVWFGQPQGPTCSVSSQVEEGYRQQIYASWQEAVRIHMQELTAVPSALAFGPLFTDQHRFAMMLEDWMFNQQSDAWDGRIWSMTTNLSPNWTTAQPNAATTIQNAIRDGSRVGFQSAGKGFFDSDASTTDPVDGSPIDCSLVSNAVAVGTTYRMQFFETNNAVLDGCKIQLYQDPPPGSIDTQRDLLRLWGG